jgi:hypothetical protein
LKRKDLILPTVVVAVVVFILAVLVGWSPWRSELDRDGARDAISKAVASARIEDGPEVDGAKILLVHVADGGVREDVLVAISSQQHEAFDPLRAAERASGARWGDEAGCKNYAVASRTTGKGSGDDGYGLAVQVEGAVRDAAPDGDRDCQG